MGMEQREKLLPLVKEKSTRYSLDYRLLDAIIQVESNYNIYAMRLEDKAKNFVIPAKFAHINFITIETEVALQKFSWGLCQVMGATARWLGFQGPLPVLCEPETNLNWCCRYLCRLRDEYGGILENVIAAYNGGSIRRNSTGEFFNQTYVDKIIKIYTKN